MKKIMALLAVMILLTGFTYKDHRPQKYATLGSYIYNLVNTSGIETNYIKAPKVSEYFCDIKDSQTSLEDKVYVSKKVDNDYLLITLDWGKKPTSGYALKIVGAREVGDFIEVYYNTKSPKAGQMTLQVITYPKDTIRLKVRNINKAYNIITKKIDVNPVSDVKYFTQSSNNNLKLTLSIGEKPTGGYCIRILEAKQIGDEIIVKYTTKTPAKGDIVTQGVTYPSDSVDVKVANINKKYNISLKAVDTSNDGIKTSTVRVGEYILVTLDWGQKPTGGYSIKILEAKQVGNTIEVKYVTKSPGPRDIVIQVLTYPKDSIKVKVDDVTKDYKVVLIK